VLSLSLGGDKLPALFKERRLPPRLLIVDDSRVSRMMIRARVLALQPDWAFQEAASGDEALLIAAQSFPDYVTMDVNMPGLNGFDAAEQLSKLSPNTRIVMLTANIQESSRARAESIGLKFVQKPITDTSMQQVIAYLTAQP
jgi:CheY-like chemotaxis protein